MWYRWRRSCHQWNICNASVPRTHMLFINIFTFYLIFVILNLNTFEYSFRCIKMKLNTFLLIRLALLLGEEPTKENGLTQVLWNLGGRATCAHLGWPAEEWTTAAATRQLTVKKFPLPSGQWWQQKKMIFFS